VSEYARAIRAHRTIESVAVFATTARADVRSASVVGDERLFQKLACTSEGVDDFLSSDVLLRCDQEAPCTEWSRALASAGVDATLLPIRKDMYMEYFNFCPRLRVLKEFFHITSPTVLTHRFCDLRLCHFLTEYPRVGHELGLAVAWFSPDCWMYFYSNVGVDLDRFSKCLESTDGDPRVIGVDGGHVSTTVRVEESEVRLAEKVFSDFVKADTSLTVPRLSRYFAVFRHHIESELVRRHTCTMDQRLLDWLIYSCVGTSFGNFVECLIQEHPSLKSPVARKLLLTCQTMAKGLMEVLDVTVVWHKPGQFIEPDLDVWNVLANQES